MNLGGPTGPPSHQPACYLCAFQLKCEQWRSRCFVPSSDPSFKDAWKLFFIRKQKELFPRITPSHSASLMMDYGVRLMRTAVVEAVYRRFKLNRVLWAAERLFSLEETLYKPQRCFRNLYSSNFHQTAWLWRIVTARKSPGFDRMDEWKRALAVGNCELFQRVFIPRLWLGRCHRSSALQNRPGTWPRRVCAGDAVLLPAEL